MFLAQLAEATAIQIDTMGARAIRGDSAMTVPLGLGLQRDRG